MTVKVAHDLVGSHGGTTALRAMWELEGLLLPHPRPLSVPHVWRWAEVAETLRSAVEVGMAATGGRRVLAFANPGLGGEPYATPTLWAAVQCVLPGETAPAHRHTAGAIRFVLEGSGVSTTVDHDPVPMAIGDLVVTPADRWHSHHATGDEPMAWFDGLDLPLVRFLDALFFEGGGATPVVPNSQAPSSSERRYLAPGLVPVAAHDDAATSLLVYRWADTDRALASLLDHDARDWATIRFVDPARGCDIMPTLRAEMTRVRAGGRTTVRRRTGSSVTVCVRGSGSLVIDDVIHDVGVNDVVALPSWSSVQALAGRGAGVDLFVLSDAPVLEVLGLLRGRDWDDLPCGGRSLYPAEQSIER